MNGKLWAAVHRTPRPSRPPFLPFFPWENGISAQLDLPSCLVESWEEIWEEI